MHSTGAWVGVYKVDEEIGLIGGGGGVRRSCEEVYEDAGNEVWMVVTRHSCLP